MGGRKSVLWAAAPVCAAVVAYLGVHFLPEIAFAARGVLAGVFLVAGVAKLRDREAFAEVLAGLGMSGWLAPSVARGLPVIELVLAGALLVPVASIGGAVGALVLTLVLTAGVVVALVRGRSVDCGCFGKDHSARLGGLTLVRNGILVGLAGGLVAAGPTDLTLSGRSLAALVVAAAVAVAFLALRRDGGAVAQEPPVQLAVVPAGGGSEAVSTRRRWIGAAGGAGLVGTLGVWLGSDVPTAIAVLSRPTTSLDICSGCYCCCPGTATGACGCTVGCCKYCCFSCAGFTGGGLVQTPSGSAQASFFGNKSKLKGNPQVIIGGALSWFDAGWQGTGLLLQSIEIRSYEKVPGTNIRQLTGFAKANGTGKHKFVLRAVDAGRPGSGSDTVNLTVSGVPAGGAGGAGAQYTANGHLVQGDITTRLQAASSLR